MHVTSGSHFWPKMDRKDFISLVIGPLMISLSCLPQSLLAGTAEGETIYQQKCAACHTIGKGRLVGPDLKGVNSKQDSAWLVRWLVEPDKMLAEGDPIATAQLKEYNNVPMPPLGVSEAQAKDILAYIKVASAGGGAAPVAVPVPVASEPAKVAKPASPENGKNIFDKTCSACHTIGQGAGVGPDLKGVTSRRDITWLLRWIQEPEKMIAEGDSIATQLLKEHNFKMPNYALSANDARDILGYIAAEGGDEAPIATVMPPSTPPAVSRPMVATITSAGDPAFGKAYFIGGKRLANGGPSCMSCHGNADISSLGGGSLGPDLTTVHLRMGGDLGLKSVIISSPFPTMAGVYSKKPVTEEEAIHLTAYFAQTKNMTEKALNFKIVGISFGGFLFMYILLHLIWRNRLTGVRKPLVGR